MFDAFRSILSRLPGAPEKSSDALTASDPRVAAAALLLHLIDADGERKEVEMASLHELVTEAYGLDEPAADAVIAAADTAVHDTVDLYTFTSTLVRDVDHDDRVEFVERMWEIVYADNALHELEEHVLWRIGELIGVERSRQIELRRRVQERLGIDRTGRPVGPT